MSLPVNPPLPSKPETAKPDLNELIRQMGGASKYNDARTALTSKYNTFALDPSPAFRLKLPAGHGFCNQAVAILARLKDKEGNPAVSREKIAVYKEAIDSVRSPDPRISERVSEMPVMVWKLPGRPEGDENRAPFAVAVTMFDRHIELLFEQACLELSPVVEELHDLLVDFGVLEWELKPAEQTNLDEDGDVFGKRLEQEADEL